MSDSDERVRVTKDELERFILAWQLSKSPEEVMERMGQPVTDAQKQYNQGKASHLRRTHGVPLRKLSGSRGGSAQSIAEMAGYAIWIKHQKASGITDGRSLRMASFLADPDKKHYVAYGKFRKQQTDAGEDPDELPEFNEWMRQTGRASEPTLDSEELEQLMAQGREEEEVME